MRGDESVGDVLKAKQSSAITLLDEFCSAHRNAKIADICTAYLPICHAGVFDNSAVAELLLSVQDESYAYIDELDNIAEGSVLLNLFSGSGRLIRELLDRGLLRHFDAVYNVDRSLSMIEFSKKNFQVECLKFICGDILTVEMGNAAYDLAVCHCGLRYVKPDCYLELATILRNLKRSCSSCCIVTEIDESFISSFAHVLKQSGTVFQWKKRRVEVQRNTTLYLSHMYYETDLQFKTIINELSLMQEVSVQDILRDTAGYKIADMNMLLF